MPNNKNNKKVTIDQLAQMVAKGFENTATKSDIKVLADDIRLIKDDVNDLKTTVKPLVQISADHEKRITKLEEVV